MDFKEWEGPVAGGLVTLVLGLFGFQTYKRNQSRDNLTEVHNSVSAELATNLDRQYDKVIAERDEAMQQARVNLDMYIAEKHGRAQDRIDLLEAKWQIKRLQDQMKDLAKFVARKHPDAADDTESSFAPLL